jgi:hypothetical protein
VYAEQQRRAQRSPGYLRPNQMKPCKSRTRFGWNTRRVQRSPFRTLTRAKAAERAHSTGKKIGFTATSSLKAQGRIRRASGWFELGPKYC